MKKKYVKIYANCLVFEGANRSIIYDLQRQFYITIPREMSTIIKMFNDKKSIEEVFTLYGKDDIEILNEYISFILNHEFGFITGSKEFDLFPELSKNFLTSSIITNCIVEISDKTLKYIVKIIYGLEKLNCKHIQLISYVYQKNEILKELLIKINQSNFRSIEIVLKNSLELKELIKEIDSYNFRVTKLTLHSCFNSENNFDKYSFNLNIINHEITDFKHCGIIKKTSLANVNMNKVLESLNHNSCLNKKVSIDKEGYIRNCPSMPQHFGNIKDTTLEEALNRPDFKKYWNVTKDMVAVCKDCEFRHVCTDCRAYTERTHFEEDIDLSKPLKCGYNPYTNEWAEWSVNPLKSKAISYYGLY